MALQFLTKIPVNLNLVEEDFSPLNMASTMTLFPLVGFLLGLLLVAFDFIIMQLSPLLKNVLLLSFYTLLTGGLHLDGFMDTLDGLLPALPPERRQDIMKDSTIGSFAAIGLILLFLLKLALFMEVPLGLRPKTLLLMPVFSRFSMTVAAFLFKSRRKEGLGYLFSQAFKGKNFIGSSLITIAIILMVDPLAFFLLFPLLLTTFLLGRWVIHRIDGLTGDSYGFILELNELFFLLFLIGSL